MDATPRILIVDDAESVVTVIQFILEAAGYSDTATFIDPCGALALLKSGIEPELIITDFDMPMMNGVELLDAARALQPNVKGLIVTSDPEAVRSKSYPVMHKDHLLAERIVADVNAVLAAA